MYSFFRPFFCPVPGPFFLIFKAVKLLLDVVFVARRVFGGLVVLFFIFGGCFSVLLVWFCRGVPCCPVYSFGLFCPFLAFACWFGFSFSLALFSVSFWAVGLICFLGSLPPSKACRKGVSPVLMLIIFCPFLPFFFILLCLVLLSKILRL